MPEVVDWRTAEPGQVAERAAAALAQGKLVAFPTETVYGIAASIARADAVERLAKTKGRDVTKPMTVAIRGTADALDWMPELGLTGRRLAQRCWPGPLTLISSEGVDAGAAMELPPAVRQRICPDGAIGLRAPDHEAIQLVLGTSGALVLTSANASGEPEAQTAREIVERLGSHLALVIDDGPRPDGKPSTVVRVQGKSWEVCREGAMPKSALAELASCVIVFVCTGNTCRSPLAEGIFKKMLAARLQCPIEALPDRGYIVRSAGLAAFEGNAAAPEAVEVARQHGAELLDHRSRMLTPEVVAKADFILVMTRTHLGFMRDLFGDLGPEPRLLCASGEDVPDPIGCDHPVYEKCAAQISQSLEALVPEVLGE
jgi:protein-tyrosine phosphatase